MKLFDVYPLFDLEPISGKGCYVFDKAGNKYLDFYGGHAVISIGHAHPTYVERVQAQVAQLGFYSNSIQNALQGELAEKLGSLSNCEDYQLFLCNSGAEANENALKLASFHNGRNKIIAYKKAFHGRTSAAVNATDNEKIKAPINKNYPIEFLDWNDTEATIKSLSNGDVAAVIIEGIQGIGGIHLPNADFLRTIQAACRKYDTILILDEIQSGYGRSGQFFAFQHIENIEPDLITVAKGMANGFPIGGVLIHEKFKATYGLLGTTFGGNHLACAAGLAVLEVIEKENLIENSAQLGTYFKKELEKLPSVLEVRGEGLMIGVSFDKPIAELRRKLLFERFIFTGSSSDKNVLRLLPPLNISKVEIDYFIKEIKELLPI